MTPRVERADDDLRVVLLLAVAGALGALVEPARDRRRLRASGSGSPGDAGAPARRSACVWARAVRNTRRPLSLKCRDAPRDRGERAGACPCVERAAFTARVEVLVVGGREMERLARDLVAPRGPRPRRRWPCRGARRHDVRARSAAMSASDAEERRREGSWGSFALAAASCGGATELVADGAR